MEYWIITLVSFIVAIVVFSKYVQIGKRNIKESRAKYLKYQDELDSDDKLAIIVVSTFMGLASFAATFGILFCLTLL